MPQKHTFTSPRKNAIIPKNKPRIMERAFIDLRKIAIVGTAIIIGIFYLSTIRHGHSWEGDFSMYIMHAMNIAEGRPYGDTGYVYNPFCPCWGPKAYPPVFPLLLTPIYKVFGLNLTAMKAEIIFLFTLSLFIIGITFRRHLSTPQSIAIITILGFNPFFWDIKDHIISDLPFLLFLFLSFFILTKEEQIEQKPLPYGILIGGLFYLCYGTRAVGILLPPSLVLYDIVKNKHIRLATLISIGIFTLLAVSQILIVHSEASYLDQLPHSLKALLFTMLKNPIRYSHALSQFWSNGYSAFCSILLCILFTGLALWGYASIVRDKRKLSPAEFFVPLYLLLISSWRAYQGLRFLIPIIPLYIYYGFTGLSYLKIGKPVYYAVITAILISYIGKYSVIDLKTIKDGIHTKESKEFVHYIKIATGEQDTFLFYRPRVLALLTRRPASMYHTHPQDSELWAYINEVGIKYVAVGPFHYDSTYLKPFIERHKEEFQEVFCNKRFIVYKVKRERKDEEK